MNFHPPTSIDPAKCGGGRLPSGYVSWGGSKYHTAILVSTWGPLGSCHLPGQLHEHSLGQKHSSYIVMHDEASAKQLVLQTFAIQ